MKPLSSFSSIFSVVAGFAGEEICIEIIFVANGNGKGNTAAEARKEGRKEGREGGREGARHARAAPAHNSGLVWSARLVVVDRLNIFEHLMHIQSQFT